MLCNIVHSGRLGGVILVAQKRTEPLLCLSGSAGDLYPPAGAAAPLVVLLRLPWRQ
jgi:hypothetical protein